MNFEGYRSVINKKNLTTDLPAHSGKFEACYSKRTYF